MLDDDEGLEAEVLDAVPIFPLPNAVLLPGMVLPLNVFEPRYLELVDYALDGGQFIGVPLLRPGYENEYEGRPETEAVFGVGRLISHQKLPDGRRFIRLAGQRRLRRVRELPPDRNFRLVECALLEEDDPSAASQLEVLKAQLERIASTLLPDDEQLVQSVLRIPDDRIFLYATAAIVPTLGLMPGSASSQHSAMVAMQQASLDADTADRRIETLVEFAGALCSQLREDGRFPETLLN
ncbi:MAG: LON peptidase substrate-binding domain-containing protein [Myxococcota bacterium]